MKTVITEYGAKGDGITVNTNSIQNAIDECHSSGGGKVVVPVGTFLTGTIELKSNVTLYLEPGSVLKASGDIHDYEELPIPSDEFPVMRALIYAINQRNIGVKGQGELDLNDGPFIDWDKPWMLDASKLNSIQLQEATVTPLDRPSQMIVFHECEGLQIEGITARHCPCYTFLFSICNDIKIRGITIDNDLRVPNNDGMHFYSCNDVIVSGCVLSCGDDCIALTCISNWDKPARNIIISDCTMVSRSSGLRIGHMASKVQNVVVNNLTITNSNRGIGIFASDDGWVKDVVISNVVIRTFITAGSWWGKGEPLVISAADSSGIISGVSLNHVRAHSENGIILVGKNGNVNDITLNDWRLTLRYGHNRPLFGGQIDLSPMVSRPAPDGRIPWLYASGVQGVRLNNVKATKETGEDDYPIDAFLESVYDVEGI